MTSWTWEYDEWVPADEQLRESLCTLGNGYFATRGAFPECDADDIHYPGTYAAGVFNRLTSHVSGRDVENEDMVNLPNWLPLRVRRVDGENSTWFTPGTARVVEHSQTLRLDAGGPGTPHPLRGPRRPAPARPPDPPGQHGEPAPRRPAHRADRRELGGARSRSRRPSTAPSPTPASPATATSTAATSPPCAPAPGTPATSPG